MYSNLKSTPILLLLVSVIFLFSFKDKGTGQWKEKQLVTPEWLADKIKSGAAADILLLNTGPVEDIKGAVNIGAVEDTKNLDKLKVYLEQVPKGKEIIIYCGCCPLSVCPNLKPAYDLLKERQFSNYKILRLTQDLQEDWIDKGYPIE